MMKILKAVMKKMVLRRPKSMSLQRLLQFLMVSSQEHFISLLIFPANESHNL